MPRIFTEDRRKAAFLFVVAIALLATMDMIVKLASTSLSTTQIVWGRYVSQSLAISIIAGPAGVLAGLRSKAPNLHVVRAFFLFIANFTFMAALRYLPLTEANVVGFAAPLLLTALSYPVLGEKVGFGRWLAVAAGFVGGGVRLFGDLPSPTTTAGGSLIIASGIYVYRTR
jgi:drug/metabolite transporter (DMT)-like permease